MTSQRRVRTLSADEIACNWAIANLYVTVALDVSGVVAIREAATAVRLATLADREFVSLLNREIYDAGTRGAHLGAIAGRDASQASMRSLEVHTAVHDAHAGGVAWVSGQGLVGTLADFIPVVASFKAGIEALKACY